LLFWRFVDVVVIAIEKPIAVDALVVTVVVVVTLVVAFSTGHRKPRNNMKLH